MSLPYSDSKTLDKSNDVEAKIHDVDVEPTTVGGPDYEEYLGLVTKFDVAREKALTVSTSSWAECKANNPAQTRLEHHPSPPAHLPAFLRRPFQCR